jgi:hypothetical protein
MMMTVVIGTAVVTRRRCGICCGCCECLAVLLLGDVLLLLATGAPTGCAAAAGCFSSSSSTFSFRRVGQGEPALEVPDRPMHGLSVSGKAVLEI